MRPYAALSVNFSCATQSWVLDSIQFFEPAPADEAGTSLRRRESRENRERLRHCNG